MVRPWFLSIALLLVAPASAQPASGSTSEGVDRAALAAAVADMCRRDVALLGEADHGDGRTIAFKSALVRALVTRCSFNTMLFESSHYDFLDYMRRLRRGQPVTLEQLGAAIGGIWRDDDEMLTLKVFLWQRSLDGRLILGGIDDQLGSAGAFYANDAMPAELAAQLDGERRAECRELLRRRVYSDFGGRYGVAERGAIQACLADIQRAVTANEALDPATREALLGMAASIVRTVARDLEDPAAYVRERDQSMYANFRWLAERLPRGSRIIVWGATSHMAKDASAMGAYAEGRNFGAYVREAYGTRAFSLGFSAFAGSHYWSREEPSRAFAAAAPGSLEERALAGGRPDAAYLGPARLATLGTLAGGALHFHEPMILRWSDVLDGVVVFRSERPPIRTIQQRH